MTLRHWIVFVSIAVLTKGGPVQTASLQLPSSAAAHQQAVVDLFNLSYTAYKSAPFRTQSIVVLTGGAVGNTLGVMTIYFQSQSRILMVWAAGWLMGIGEWFEEAVGHVATVDFSISPTDDYISVFETTIRHVGGLLSAYELSGKQYGVLVQKAEQVAQQLAYAFTGDNSIPYPYVNFTDHTPVRETSNIAEAGTLTLEWNRLSLYTGNNTYRELAEKSVQHMINMPKVLPGMPALSIDPSTGNSVDSYVTWGGGCDSFYEYLMKYSRLTNTNDTSYVDTWLTAVDTTIKVLMKTSTVDNWVYLADYDGRVLHVGSHLACFYGGNWILGGKLTNNDTIFNIGLLLTDACWNIYTSTATGIGPETFAFMSSDGNYTASSPPTAEQMQFYHEHGFYITGSDYIQRPEVLESNFYAWRATGDTKYLDNAASAIQSFRKYLPTTVAFAGINDVNNATSTKIDDMESFWFGEVLKYLYLTFDDPNRISLDDYVFNTECHPFKAPPAKNVYGSMS